MTHTKLFDQVQGWVLFTLSGKIALPFKLLKCRVEDLETYNVEHTKNILLVIYMYFENIQKITSADLTFNCVVYFCSILKYYYNFNQNKKACSNINKSIRRQKYVSQVKINPSYVDP